MSNIIANTTVLLALAILLGYSFSGLVTEGPGVGLQSVGPDWMIFAGNVVFSFECINFVIPMYDAHEKKETFAPILAYTLLAVCALFIIFGGVNYAFYGIETRPFVTLNLRATPELERSSPSHLRWLRCSMCHSFFFLRPSTWNRSSSMGQPLAPEPGRSMA